MLRNELARTAWYAEPYDERLQHVLLQPMRARPRPGRLRNLLRGRSRLALVMGLIVVATLMATSVAHAQRNPICATAMLEFSAFHSHPLLLAVDWTTKHRVR